MADSLAAVQPDLLRAAARCLRTHHEALRRSDPSPLDAELANVAVALTHAGEVGRWLDLVLRAYWACGGRVETAGARRGLARVLAAFAATIGALEIVDDLVDGDDPAGGPQAPNLALALLGASTELLAGLPRKQARAMLRRWGDLWLRCAAAQAREVALTTHHQDVAVEEALIVAEGSGLVTAWAVEAGALAASAPPALLASLVDAGRFLGTAEKLLHDLHDLWPGPHRSRDLERPRCTLALSVARAQRIVSATCGGPSDDLYALRQHLLEQGVLHHAWACADQYRLAAAAALNRFAQSGGDPTPLAVLVNIPDQAPATADGEVSNPRVFLLPPPIHTS